MDLYFRAFWLPGQEGTGGRGLDRELCEEVAGTPQGPEDAFGSTDDQLRGMGKEREDTPEVSL